MRSTLSHEFEQALPGRGGSLTAECICGRLHFANGPLSAYYEAGELERLLANAKEKPELYIEDSQNDSIGICLVNGCAIVIGCSCEHLEKMEAFFVKAQDWIVEFYKARNARLKREAESANQALDGL